MPIDTHRLLIRTVTAADWPVLKAIAEDFNRSPHVFYDVPHTAVDCEIQRMAQRFEDSRLFFAVCLKETGAMIGYICFHRTKDDFDMGYCFLSAYHDNGYAAEACLSLMHYMEQTHDVALFTAGTALDNTPSCKLLKKLGFVMTGTERLSFHRDCDGNAITFEGGIFTKGGKNHDRRRQDRCRSHAGVSEP